MSEFRQIVELRAPTGFEIVDIKLQLKPSKVVVVEKPDKKLPITIKKRDSPPPLENQVIDHCEICGSREGRGYCAKCFREHCSP